MAPPSIQAVRTLVLTITFAVAAISVSPSASAKQWGVRPPRPVDAATFDQLLEAVRAEPFTDGKLERVRAVAGGKRYVFTSGQVTALLDAFTYWTDRLEALRLLPVIDRDNAAAVARYFAPAPATTRSEAARILQVAN